MMSNSSNIFNNLSEQEKQIAMQILAEMSSKGASAKLDELKYADYKEIPVDIITFVKDPKYLGNAWHTSEGKCKLFPYWENKLRELFPDNVSTNYRTFILSGGRGLGKSEVAVTAGIYLMYRILCLKDPRTYYNLKPTETIDFAFMNITLAAAEEIGVSKFQKTVQCSPWFLEHGTLSGRKDIVWNPPDYINIIIGSQSSDVIGRAIYFCFFDEISFIRNMDVSIQKARALDMIDTALGGMNTRFTNKGKNPTLLCLGSSKRSEKSFMEDHIKTKAKTDAISTLIVDEPTWNVRPPEEYSGKRFYVAQGNRFLSSEVLPDDVSEEEIKARVSRGYKILEVPVEYKAIFSEEIDRALCDYAGISSSELTTYISGERISRIIDESHQNPFTKDIIEVGNAPDDKAQYSDFFDLSKVDPILKSRPLFVHLDMSISGDKTGIGGTWIEGMRPPKGNDDLSKELMFRTAFGVSVKAPKGYQVSFEKNRNFIRWLKSQGFRIAGVSFDTFQSADLAQSLSSEGFKTAVLSVDRVDPADKVCKPYHYLKNTIYEERVKFFYSKLLIEELTGLERDNTNGKVDHSPNGINSKDLADAICGSLYNASQHAAEFSFDYGETLDTVIRENSVNNSPDRQQITLDFEEELKRAYDPIKEEHKKEQSQKDGFTNFGFGKAQPYDSAYLSQGIIVGW